MQPVHCISVSEHIWVGGCGPRGVEELPAGGIRASQGTFSSFKKHSSKDKLISQVSIEDQCKK